MLGQLNTIFSTRPSDLTLNSLSNNLFPKNQLSQIKTIFQPKELHKNSIKKSISSALLSKKFDRNQITPKKERNQTKCPTLANLTLALPKSPRQKQTHYLLIDIHIKKESKNKLKQTHPPHYSTCTEPRREYIKQRKKILFFCTLCTNK